MSDFHRDPYRVLGVSKDAGLTEIRRAYWALARRFRGDAQERPAEARLEEIQRAYMMLSEGERRRDYDSRRHARRNAPRSDPGDTWDSDEIAVDFPSMGAILERMRAAFFGGSDGLDSVADETRSTHTAEVELTARQADEGVRVPLDLPIRHTCPMCGGRGEVWTEPCGVCAGTGGGFLSHQLQLQVPAGVRHGARLRFSVSPPYAPETRVEVRIAIQ